VQRAAKRFSDVREQIVLPYLWRRYLSLLRAMVGGACLWMLIGSSSLLKGVWPVMLAIVTIYSLVSLFWSWPDRVDRLGILGRVLDFVTFLLCAAMSGTAGFWVAAFAALYLFLSYASSYDWREVLLVTVLSLAFINIIEPAETARMQVIILLLGMMGCVLALQKQSLLDRLSASSKQAVLYRSEAAKARESERERIAADFHDGPLQSFISIQMRLEVARKILAKNQEAGLDELHQLQELLKRQVTEVRTFVRSMRPVEVEGAGLATALRSVIASFQKDSGITATFQADPSASHDDLDATTDLIQIIRESLHNVQKHSNASRVSVAVRRDNGRLEIDVEDDGSGFPFAGKYSLEEMEMLGIGPMSIKRRVRSLNGDLQVDSRPGRGAALHLSVPV
jgi:signal transduction histidine kinase